MDVSKQKTGSYQKNKRTCVSKEEFVNEFKRLYDEKSKTKELYLLVLTEQEKAILESDIDSFKILSGLIDYTSDLKDLVTLSDNYDNINPVRRTNLIYLASQHSKLNILQYLVGGDSQVLCKLAILAEDGDEVNINTVYYAIRSGNVRLLDILIKKWPDNSFTASTGELEVVLSRAYDELRLKNVPLSEEMEGFVENELINLRFFSNVSGQNQSCWGDISKTRERIALVLKFVGFLKTNYSDTEEVDGRFIFVAKSIAQNINILKQRLKSTYDRLPWEEMEFCLVIFVSSRTKLQELNLFYRTILNKAKILKYVENFANELGTEEDITKGEKLYCLPRGQKRKNVVAKIIGICPQFEELYNDYQQIRDIYSLQKISDNIKLALLADPQEKEGQLVITRVLQVIGEHIKNTLESPKLSHTTSEHLVLSLPKNTRQIIVDLRDAISHADALSTRIQIEENADSFFNIKIDVKKIGNVITGILYKNKIKIIRILLTKIVNSDNSDEIKDVLQELSVVDFDEMVDTVNLKTMEQKKMEGLVKELSDNIIDKTDYENELFSKISSIIDCAVTELEIIRSDYIVGIANLQMFSRSFCDNRTDPDIIKTIKFHASTALQNIVAKIEYSCLKEIGDLARTILRSAESRVCDGKFDDLERLTEEIVYFVKFEIDCIMGIRVLREELSEKDSRSRKRQQRKPDNLTGDENLLTLKLSELKAILSKNLLIGPLVNALGFHKKDTKIVAAVEMLVLDIMEILGNSKNFLENNLLFLDDDTPLLNGKCLRNHLAHENAVVDVLLSDPSRAVLLNARKLIEEEENIMRRERKIGKLVSEDPDKLEEKFEQSLNIITNQERMFGALEEGNLESLQDCVMKGADIKARSVSLWTTLHFAAKGISLEVVKFILDRNLNANVKDNDGQTPLHIAAAYGRQNIVDFFVTEAGLCVNELTKHSKAPLHFAAQNGHEGTVEILLKHKAKTSTHDARGLSPLHYAIMNNHISVAKSLFEKEVNVDINETIGGSTPIHVAAECGRLELVNLFLEMGANVNITTDENTTPLHLAAWKGHPKVVNALILNGANVNAGDLSAFTPLHYAVIWDNLDIINILLKHGANVNAGGFAVESNTPLHVAIRSGHVNPGSFAAESITPLHVAIRSGFVNAADFAVEGITPQHVVILRGHVNAGGFAVENITPLHVAIRSGHLEIVAALIQHGADIHAKSSTPLHYAASQHRPEFAALLIENGAEINAKAYNNLTALHIAAGEGHKDVTHLLIKSHAEVNAQDVEGYTPLHAAARNGIGKDVINLLIKHGAEVNSKSVVGETPLHLAVTSGHEVAVEFLIKNNATVNCKNKEGLTPLHLAVSRNHKNIVKLLIENKAQVNEEGFGNCTPLRMAAQAGHKEIVEILLAQGANFNDESYVLTPLFDAIKYNHKEIVEVFLSNGANISSGDFAAWTIPVLAVYKDIIEILLKNQEFVNYKDSKHFTPLHFAVSGGHKGIAKKLMEKGANIDAVTINNLTPMFVAAKEGCEEVVKMLLASGANVNIKSKNNVTPLHIAAMNGHSNVVKVLLDKVDINVRDINNETSLQSAVRRGHLEVVKMLLQYKKEGNDDVMLLHTASRGSNIELVEYLVDQGFDINVRNLAGLKPIHVAAGEGFIKAVDFFLSKGLSITDLDVRNWTLLHYTARKGNADTVKYLIEQGADVNAQDIKGVTPMHVAASFGNNDVIEVLLQNGAVHNPVDKLFRRPLEMANNKDVVDLLLSTEMLFEAIERNSSSEALKYITMGGFVSAKNAEGRTPLHYAARKGNDEVVNVLLQNNANPNAIDNKGITPLHCAAEFSHLKIVKALLSNHAVYDAVSVDGKTPSDLTVDEGITDLFKLLRKAFKNIKNDKSRFIKDLSKIKDIDIVKSIMCARNRENKTLVVAAIHSNFSKVQRLKEISQGDVSAKMTEAKKLLELRQYQKALHIFKSILEIRKEILRSDNPGTFDIQKYIVQILCKQGAYKEALETSEEIYQKEKEILGLNNKDTLNTKSTIALIKYFQGKDEEALHIYQEVYQKQKDALGSNHSGTFRTQLNMALVLDRQGKHEEAININKLVFEQIKYGDHPTALRILNNIASALINQGNHEYALGIYVAAMGMATVFLGKNHFETLKITSNIAGVLGRQKKYRQCLKLYQGVLNIQENVLEPNHPDILKTKCRLAATFFLHDKTRTVFGPNHPSVLNMLKQIQMINFVFEVQDNKSYPLYRIAVSTEKHRHIVARKGDVHTLQSRLSDGGNANDKDIDGRTPLHHIVYNGHIDIVNMLLKFGASR